MCCDFVKAECNDCQVESEVNQHEKYSNTDRFLEAAQKNGSERSDQNERDADAMVQKYIDGKPVRKFVYVRGKLANLVV